MPHRLILAALLCVAFAVPAQAQTGMASWYQCCNPITACGVAFRPSDMGAAHRTLPCGTKVRVTRTDNGKHIVVTIRDRGPYSGGRVIDLYRGAADALGIRKRGTARVSITVIQ